MFKTMITFLAKFKKINSVLISVFFFLTISCILVLLIELSFFVLIKIVPLPSFYHNVVNALEYKELYNRKEFWASINGFPVPNANSTTKSTVKFKDGSIVFDVTYSIDSYSHRTIPDQDKQSRNKFLLVFGDSRIFGVGVNDNETLPYFLSKFISDYHIYNYSIPNFGIENAYMLMQHNDISNEISETEGSALIFFNFSQVLYLIGSMDYVTSSGEQFSHLCLNEKNEFEVYRNYKSKHPWKFLLYKILSKSNMVKFFRIDFPSVNENSLTTFLHMIDSIKEMISSSRKFKNIYFVFLPSYYVVDQDVNNIFKKMLDFRKISYLDLSQEKFDKNFLDNLYLKGDFHYTPQGMHAFAEVISDFLIKQEKL